MIRSSPSRDGTDSKLTNHNVTLKQQQMMQSLHRYLSALLLLQSLMPWRVRSMGHGSVGLLFNGLIYGGLSTAADDYDEHRNSIISIILQKIENCSAFSDVYAVSEEVCG